LIVIFDSEKGDFAAAAAVIAILQIALRINLFRENI
jgi:hypothetical protein